MNIHPKRILWPTDFSELSAKGGAYARAFADALQAEVHVIHVCQPLLGSTADLPLSPAMTVGVTQREVVRAAEGRLKDLVARDFRECPTVAYAVHLGIAWQEICRYAESEKIDLIIIGTHGYTGLLHVLIGSVAERVVQHAPCPVLTVKTNERDFVQR
jgi:universal stress protein A